VSALYCDVSFWLHHLAFAVGLALSAFTVGRRLLARLPAGSLAEEVALSTAVGLGVFSHALFALGLLGQLRAAPVLLTLGALTVGCALPWRALRRPRPTWVSLAFAGGCALLFVLALYPSTAWDANSYHLPTAAWWIAQHRVTPAWPLRFPVTPGAQDLLFALGLLAGDTQCAQLVEASFCAITALALYAAGRRRSERAGTWAAALWLGSPMVMRLGSTAYADAGLAAWCTLSVLALDRHRDEARDGWLVVAAVLAGLAASSKLLGLFFVAVVAVAAARRWRVLVVLLLVAAPWYIYVACTTGNPVFPWLGGVLGRGPWSADDLARQLDAMRGYGVGRSWPSLVTLPFRLAFQAPLFAPERLASPLPVLALLPALWLAHRDRALRRWLAIALAYIGCWFVGAQLYRYLMPVLPLVALVGGVTLAELLPASRLRAAVIAAALLALGPAWAAWELLRHGPPPRTDEQRAAWLAARMPAFRAVRFAAARGARVYQLGLEDYVIYAGPDVVGDWFGPWRYARLMRRDADAVVGELAAMGAHWLVTPQPAFRPGLQVPPHPRLKPRYTDDAAIVYEVTP